MPKSTVLELSKSTWIYSLLATVVLAVAVIAGIKMWPGNEATRTISVRGECITKVEKDRTTASFRVTVLDRNASVSLRRAQAAYARISEHAAAVQSTDPTMELQTARFDTHEKNRWDHITQQEISLGFETNIELVISSENRAVIENLLTRFSNEEHVFPGQLSMISSSKVMKPAIENCIKDAVKNARERADAVASAAGARVGRLMSANFDRTSGGARYGGMEIQPMMARSAMAMGGGGGVELFSTDTEISITINATFGLR